MGMSQFQHYTTRLKMIFLRSRAVIVMEIAATGDAAARRMRSCASQLVESVKALHVKTAVMMLLNLKMT